MARSQDPFWTGGLALCLLLALPAQAEDVPAAAPSAESLWREVLAQPGESALLSYGENGYRLTVRVSATADQGPVRMGRLTWLLSEIDTSRDEPAFGPARRLKARPGLPAQVVVAEGGVSFLWRPATPAAVRKRARSAATFAGGAGVTVRRLLRGDATCFRAPEVKGGAELCLAPGAGLVAVTGAAPSLPGVAFARQGWLAGE